MYIKIKFFQKNNNYILDMFKSIKKYCATTTILTPSIYSMEKTKNNENCNKITNVQSNNNLFKKIKSNLRVRDIFDILGLNKKLNIIRYNNDLQTRLNCDISNYRPSVKAQIYLCNMGEKNTIFNLYEGCFTRFKVSQLYNNKEIPLTVHSEKLYEKLSSYYVNLKNTSFYSKHNIDLILNIKIYDLTSLKDLFYGCNRIIKIVFLDFYSPYNKNCAHMFERCFRLENICNFNILDTKNVTDMSYMFSSCKSLLDIDLSNFKTGNVTNMSYMFYECLNIKNLNLINFDTRNVTNMKCIFGKCGFEKFNTGNQNLNNFNTQNVKTMRHMFFDCTNLKEINMRNFTISKNCSIALIFSNCKRLIQLTLPKYLKNRFEEPGFAIFNGIKNYESKIKINYVD